MLGGLFRNKQDEDQADRLPVGGIKSNGCIQADEGADGFSQPFDPAVRDGDALPQPGRAQPFPGEQAVKYQVPGNALIVLEQQADLFEHAFLAADVQVQQNIAWGKQFGDQIHELIKGCRGARGAATPNYSASLRRSRRFKLQLPVGDV